MLKNKSANESTETLCLIESFLFLVDFFYFDRYHICRKQEGQSASRRVQCFYFLYKLENIESFQK